jgi:hypothetical protein
MKALTRPQNPPANQAKHLSDMIQPVVAFIVLCLILILGLLIPLFSLGRRIERTEDIVINRDPASIMERSQVNEGEKDGVISNLSEMEGQEDKKRERAEQKGR